MSSPIGSSAIDLAHLARQTGGDRALERELLTLFAGQCSLHLRTIHASADRRERMDAAHTLKGAARAVGAWQVAEAAGRVEEALAGPRDEPGDAALDALALAAAEARAAIARLEPAA
ncbi:Hpt domain-containing protein [Bosea sp. (in: a-proteobacteria)]|uniref:Hpt domain-containing protein n=1 Tax=Bosea sp. (in: a-proteobacteria) TaxID=1871050 RepID=UPI0026120A04|nr:Hpt domain-containing protein [Bosea sp. (in: a-proteobacteria)]MCO5092500.1 Hpt domain-containing protein [Bosea sp. (in: a-proteobacteria)]